MGTIVTSTVETASAFTNQRKIDRCANGNLVYLDVTPGGSGSSGVRVSVSADGSVTWSSANSGGGYASTTSGNAPANGSAKLDEDDYLHVVYKDPSDGYLRYMRGTPNAARTAWTLTPPVVVGGASAVYDVPDLTVFRHPTTSGAYLGYIVASAKGSNSSKVYGWPVNIASGGSITIGSGDIVSASLSTGNAVLSNPSIDHQHVGDGKTVKDGLPHLFVAWYAGVTGTGGGLRFRKATYAAGSFTWGTEREIDNAKFGGSQDGNWLNCVFDGQRVVIGGYDYNTATLFSYDRDAADTTTTPRVSSTLTPATGMAWGGLGYDASGSLYFFGTEYSSGSGSRSSAWQKWDRATGVLGARQAFDTTTGKPYTAVRRGVQGQQLDYVYTDGSASPYSVMSGRVVLNQNPTAPTPLTPADNATWDSSTDQTVTFKHNDPDGDAASAWRIRYRPKGTTAPLAYLTGTTTVANGATITAPVPANTWTGDVDWEPQTYDASGAEGAWGVKRTAVGIPTALAAATGGQGGTSVNAVSLYNQAEAERATRTSGRSALATVASIGPLTITVEGSTVSAVRNASYTPVIGDSVQATFIGSQWVVQDKVTA